MIKLVTQFDHADTRASAATPTCGGCCCCCCCIASLISTSAFTAMHLRVHARRLKQTTGTSPSPRPEIAGALALPSALVFTAIFAQSGSEGSTLVLGTTAWFLILLGLYRWVQAKRPWVPALVTVAIGGALLFGELVVALAVLADIGAYLFLALVFSIIAIVFEYALLLGRR